MEMQKTKSKLIKIGLLVREDRINDWEALMLKKVFALSGASVTVILRFNQHKHDTFEYKAKGKIYEKIIAFDQKKFKISRPAIHMIPIEPLIKDIPLIWLEPEVRKRKIHLIDEVLKKVEEEDLDLIISIGKGPLIKSLAPLTRLGLWTHFPEHEGGKVIPTAGFWELINGRGTAMGAVYTVSPIDGEEYELYSSHSSTEGISIHKIYNRVYWKMASFIPRLINNIVQEGDANIKDHWVPEFKIKNDDIWKNSLKSHYIPLVKYTYQFLNQRILKKKIRQKWIMLYDLGEKKNLDFSTYKIIFPKAGEFWADPFIIHENDKYFIFFEACPNIRRAKGYIAYIEMDAEGNYNEPKTIIKRDYHLSYPHLFQWEGDWYMIPETADISCIQLYKCIRFPDQWEFQYNLMENISAVDTTLLNYNGKWWLFVNITENEHASSWDELFIFYGDSPIGKDWTPHPMNPVISDVRSSRPAGNIFIENGKLIRPSQNSSYIYGYGLKFNEITKLSETEYEEKLIDSFLPDWDKSIKAIHTYNRTGKLTLIDAIYKNKEVY